MSDKTKKKVNLNKERLLQRLDLLGYEAYKKLLDLEYGKTKQPINRMSINVVRLDYILPLPILLYTFDIHQKIQYEEMNRNKDQELAYIKLENMDAAYAINNYTLIDYTVIPFNPDFDGIMTKKALIDAVEEYNNLYKEGQKKLFGSKNKQKVYDTTNVTLRDSDTTSELPPADEDERLKYDYEIPKWILKKNKRKEKLLKEIKKKGLKKLEKNYINKDVDIKSLIDKYPGDKQHFVIEDDDKEGYITLRYTGHETRIITEIKKLNNQPLKGEEEGEREQEDNNSSFDNKQYTKKKREKDQKKRSEKRRQRKTKGKHGKLKRRTMNFVTIYGSGKKIKRKYKKTR
tara:strand:- start:425 stop:1459 length:1035 start_codon:yes stop_codon:yes gene_type:complete